MNGARWQAALRKQQCSGIHKGDFIKDGTSITGVCVFVHEFTFTKHTLEISLLGVQDILCVQVMEYVLVQYIPASEPNYTR